MTVQAITLGCDTPGCRASAVGWASMVDEARLGAAERSGWTQVDGKDFCGPCSRGEAEASVAYYRGGRA